MDLLLPRERRDKWFNRLTNEANFGVIAMEPGESQDQMVKLHDSTYESASEAIFLPWRLALSKELYLPETKETVPFEDLTIGVLKSGITDPNHPEFHSLSDWYSHQNILELRIPWMMLGYTDPSTHQAWDYPYKANELKATTSEGISVQVQVTNQPSSTIEKNQVSYRWNPWDMPTYHERKKASFFILKEYFQEQREPRSE
ncbi:hypothetical protein [Ammoniphilus sp. CFH 90114]|uniref:hypothetical protein n=1 Tax=Ammoniphilus sp. CFH 90114 TaxID=2493665 RepID=UPI00100F5A9B|nr:hypothetical protein [Ammoniphilus sp. CFH 90114]RXT02370.1 hypothetical protein EIZ39_24680 [Ammoniphilus sp. CFH 90114]